MALEAIQVLGSVDDKVRSGGITFEVKKIQTVQRFKDDLPSLEEVLLCEDFKDLPVLVFSIAGKTRGGKSFLLNLMIKYLEYLESLENKNPFVGEDWLTGKVPNCFTWKNGIESVTRGLWICPKIFRLKDAFDNQVGVLLLDAEGMYDGEATDGEIIAISGISAAISYLQIFNMKEKITSDYLEAVVRNLIRGIEEMDSEETKDLREEYKLMFVVRDWIGEDDFPFGLEGGKDYIDKESQRGTRENKQLWEVINNTFSDSKCVLLPDPGRQVTKRQFNETGDLERLEEEFLVEVRRFVEDLFRHDKLIPPSTTLTGQHIYKILKSIDGKIADEDLSFLNIFTENGNSSKVDKWISRFEVILEDVEFSGLPSVKDEMFEILRKAERTLRGKSRTTFLAELTEAIEGAYNRKVIEIILKQYTCSFHKDAGIEKQQTAIWPDVNRKLKKHLCGNNESRQNANLIFIKKSAAYYYNLLQKQHKRQFENKCTTKATLEDLAGLDEKEIKSFKECDDFTCDENAKEAAYALWLKEFQYLKHGYLNIMLEQVSKITGILFGSLKKLRNKQYDHFENFTLLNREWDEIDVQDELLIAKKVGYALFGLPGHLQTVLSQSTDISQTRSVASTSTSTSAVAVSSVRTATSAFAAISTFIKSNRNDENKKTGYSSVQESKIWPIVKRIISLSKIEVKFSCIFLNYFLDKDIVSIPLLKIKTESGITYIDSNNREYLGWDDFLINNTLSDVVYCYPLKGCYSKSEGFGIAFSKTPASKTVTKVLKVTDKVGKGVTFGAGVAAVAVACGVAAPLLVPVTVLAGGASGIYGVFRGVQKIIDKNKHREPIGANDIFNVTANAFAVVGAAGVAFGRLATFATEGAVILGSKVASISTIVIFTDSNNTAELISLVAQVEDNSLKILFYFNAKSSEDALEAIRKSLKLENKSTFDTLFALLNNNCIQFTIESGKEDVKVTKYISQSTTTLVTSLLMATSSDIKEISVYYCEMKSIIQLFVNGIIGKVDMAEKLEVLMKKLFVKFEGKTPDCRDRFVNILSHNLDSLSDDIFKQSFRQIIFGNDGPLLVLAFKYLTLSLISAMREANNFFNNIAHETITLKDHYLDEVSCHPLDEISRKVREMVEQKKSAIDLITHNSDVDYFILEVLNMLKENSSGSWSVHQFVSYITKITEDLVSRSKTVIIQHKKHVDGQENLTCNNLNKLFIKLGIEGYNYGMGILKRVLNETTVDVDAIDAMNEQQVSNLILPAWSGILDDFYCYYSKLPVGNNKLELVQQIENIREDNYIVFDLQDYNLSVIVPSDASLCDEGLSAFVVYSVSFNKGEHGFILHHKKDKN